VPVLQFLSDHLLSLMVRPSLRMLELSRAKRMGRRSARLFPAYSTGSTSPKVQLLPQVGQIGFHALYFPQNLYVKIHRDQ
jgi:hypothetical protein